jgi:hypothetical protein
MSVKESTVLRSSYGRQGSHPVIRQDSGVKGRRVTTFVSLTNQALVPPSFAKASAGRRDSCLVPRNNTEFAV